MIMGKNKIIATVGPSSYDRNIINKMDESGIDIFRINLSHTKIENLSKVINNLKEWTKKTVAIDSEGAQLRTGLLMNDNFKISSGEVIEMVSYTNYKNIDQIPLNQNSLSDCFIGGEVIRIDFNNVILQIIEIKNDSMKARVIEGGIINSNKGISIDNPINLTSFTKKDFEAFKIASDLGINTVFLSFCSKSSDVDELRSLFKKEIFVISKIENELGVKNLKEICSSSNGILIDRGDLSRDISLEKIAFAQSHILKIANEFKIDKYVATNLMENMIENENPTRAEIHDIVASIKSGANGLVLAAETAIGNNPVNCVRVLSRIMTEIENSKILYLLGTDYFQNQLKRFAVGSVIQHLRKSDLISIIVPDSILNNKNIHKIESMKKEIEDIQNQLKNKIREYEKIRKELEFDR
mgnify:CR=1 FL=1